jgi:hypothetical protein
VDGLDRHLAPHKAVQRAVYDAHASLTEDVAQLIAVVDDPRLPQLRLRCLALRIHQRFAVLGPDAAER